MKAKKREKLADLAIELQAEVDDVVDYAYLFESYNRGGDLVELVVTWNAAVDALTAIGEYIQKHAVSELVEALASELL